jgi:hypothetical protein
MTLESRAAPIEIPENKNASVSHRCAPKTPIQSFWKDEREGGGKLEIL